MTNKASWWSRASTEQKLAQIDGGIECKMTVRQIALNVGGSRPAVAEFGRKHGRRFTGSLADSASRCGTLGGRVTGLKKARSLGLPDYEISSAFKLFGDAPHERPFMDEVPA